MSTNSTNAVNLFYCYAHEDEIHRLELEKHLASFKRQGYLTSWSDLLIPAGAEWRQEIAKHLSSANMVVLLISPDFIYSDSCDEEMHQALAYQKEGRAQVVPIIVRPVVLQHTSLVDLQLLPAEGKPISHWADRDEAWQEVASKIGQIISNMLKILPVNPEKVPTTPTPPKSITLPTFVPRNPYKGLQPFTSKDAGDFFGRGRLVIELLEKMRTILSLRHLNQESRLLTVFGPSGSGKSSVVMAGLIPALQSGGLPGSENWIYLEPITPGTHPLEALARTFLHHFPQRSFVSLQEDLNAASKRGLHLLTEMLLKGKSSMVVLYIDQFEELFTQTLEEAERLQFIDILLTAMAELRGPLFVILSLRADFYDRPMRFPELFRLIQTSQVPVLPLDYRDLRDIIRKPAALLDVQLQFEDDLAGELLADVHGQSSILPLLQFALDLLFQKRQGHLLTLLAYHEMDGVKGALSKHAEETYQTLPSDISRNAAREIFLRLVDPGTENQDATRRRAFLLEFTRSDVSQAQLLHETLDAFIKARLLTASDIGGVTTIEVSHEALIREWTRFSGWLIDAHRDIRFQQALTRDADAWEGQRRSNDRLYRGSQLKEAQAWMSRNAPSPVEATFVQKSLQRQRNFILSMLLLGIVGIGIIGSLGVLAFQVFAPSPTLVMSPAELNPFSSKCAALANTNVFQCIALLKEANNSPNSIHWRVNTDISGNVRFNPAEGNLSPGGSIIVTISAIPCKDGSFTFQGLTPNSIKTSYLSALWRCSTLGGSGRAGVFLQNVKTFTVQVDPNGLLSNSPIAINELQEEIKSQPILQGQNVGLVTVFAGAPTDTYIAEAQQVDEKVTNILKLLGKQGFAFQRSAYYGPFYILGSSANEVHIDVFLIQQ